MKDYEICYQNIQEGAVVCINCAAKARKKIICGAIYQHCCDDRECICVISREVFECHGLYPGDYCSPDGFQIVMIDAQEENTAIGE